MAASRKASAAPPPDLPDASEDAPEQAGPGAAPAERTLFKRKKLDPLRGHPIEDPFEVEQHLVKGQFAPLDLHLLNLRAHRLKAMRHEGITTLAQLRRKIKILPHQVKAAIKVLNQMQGRGILADEVGLGKTIEAGIVMKELITRGKARSILILTPASLAGQWQEEMWDKFGERFVRHDDEEFKGFSHHDKIVASIDTAKSPQHSRDIIAREWDLVIIDEAHYLKNKKTQRYSLADDITARHALMLTATPIQNNLIELYNLINLIKPGLLGTMQNFEEEYIGDAQGRVLLHAQRLQTLLQQVLIRNRRAETGLKFPERKVETHRIKASKGEYDLHQAVSNFIRTYKDFFESHLALMVLEREVASSAPALVKTLNNMSPKVHDPEVATAMDELKALAEAIKRNSKVNLILDIAKNTKEKMIVFTQFRETQELLSRRLKQEGVENVKFHGQLTPGRRRNALEEFRGTRKDSPQVLVATDSGSEGLNLQFCHILVNYDLPWNPMRVEQRIGRVHRIGQDSSNVVILNLAVADTIEDYVLQVLYEKIKLFEVAIGEMDLILSDIDESGGLEKRILDIILETKTDKEVKDSLDRVHREVRKSKEQAEEIKMLDASVFQQFDLSTAKDDVQIEDSVDLDQEVRTFVLRFLEATGAEAEDADHITTVRMPRTFWKRLGGVHTYTTDPETFEEKDGEVELLSLGSKFVQGAMGLLQEESSVGQVRTAEVDQPTTVLYYRYFIETIRSEIEAFLTVEVHDDGTIESVRQELSELPDGEPVDGPIALTPRQWEDLAEKARFEVGTLLQPILQAKREEAQAEVRRTEKRLEQYYERLKEETRQEEQKIRHKMGKIRNRLWFNENGIRERKLEDEYTQLEEQLHKATFQNNKRVEDLDKEMKDRMGREQEKNEPRLALEVIGATRLLPYPAAPVAAKAVAGQRAAAASA
ncbi:MAG TPA: SNF2-related protein [Candidatus Thermoplasmatota archaeon]|nr:SNF2-related protein [Candidatus Thermoplasmatota archaeon]